MCGAISVATVGFIQVRVVPSLGIHSRGTCKSRDNLVKYDGEFLNKRIDGRSKFLFKD
jgi:hypothetical protein